MSASAPTAVFDTPEVLSWREICPTATLEAPVVFDCKEAYPTAVLLLAVLFVKELDPTATFWLTFAEVSKAEVPIATLCAPVAFPKPAL